MIAYTIIAAIAVTAGVVAFLQTLRHQRIIAAAKTGGWVYFISAVGGALEDPPSPVKIGMTHRDPTVDRLPEIETMSPEPLELLYSFRCKDAALVERAIHDELAPYRRHGEWFDRDAALSWLDGIIQEKKA